MKEGRWEANRMVVTTTGFKINCCYSEKNNKKQLKTNIKMNAVILQKKRIY